MVATNAAVRAIGLPALELWEVVLRRLAALPFMEGNESTIQIIKTGHNPTMRHISLTHGVNVAWLRQVFHMQCMAIMHIVSALQRADIFTKAFDNGPKWQAALETIGMVSPPLLSRGRETPGSKAGKASPALAAAVRRKRCVPVAGRGSASCCDPLCSLIMLVLRLIIGRGRVPSCGVFWRRWCVWTRPHP